MNSTSLPRPAMQYLVVCCWLVAVTCGSRGSAFLQIDFIPICQVQGEGFTAPYAGQIIQTRGIVTLDLDHTSRRGFFFQDDTCDGNATTSDALFVYLGKSIDLVQTGDAVQVTGLVQEYYGLTELVTSPEEISVLSSGNALPGPIEISPPISLQAAHLYLERLEGMRVSIDQAVAVGPTGSDGRTWVVQSDLGIQRVFADDPGGTGEILCIDQEGVYPLYPEVKVGDEIAGVQGIVDYSLGVYCLQLSTPPWVTPLERGLHPPIIPEEADRGLYSAIRLATANLANLFDTEDDPGTEDTVLNSSELQRRLQKRAILVHDHLQEPALLAVQEVENSYVLQALINRPEIKAQYLYLWQNGPDRRGLDLALLYRPDLARILEYRVVQGCTSLVDGLDPDGNGDLTNPQNGLTCDTNGDGILDGNRLFSRPPLVAHVQFSPAPITNTMPTSMGESINTWILVCHFKSKTEDTDLAAYTLPRRIEQAQFITQLINQTSASHPGESIIALGDFNDLLGSQVAQILETRAFDLVWQVPHSRRYSYIFQGVSQTLDHIYTRLIPPVSAALVDIPHVNADYPATLAQVSDKVHRSSDHDPVLAVLNLHSSFSYLPLVQSHLYGVFR